MNNQIFEDRLITHLQEKNLILVDKNAFLDFMIEVNVKTKVDKRVKWITRQQAIPKYNLTRYQLRVWEKDPYSVLKWRQKGTGPSKKYYNEQSIIDEQSRLSEV